MPERLAEKDIHDIISEADIEIPEGISLMERQELVEARHRGLDTAELIIKAAADAYRYFGGTEHLLPLPVDQDAILGHVSTNDFEEEHVLWGHEQDVAGLAMHYLRGEGADYPAFLSY